MQGEKPVPNDVPAHQDNLAWWVGEKIELLLLHTSRDHRIILNTFEHNQRKQTHLFDVVESAKYIFCKSLAFIEQYGCIKIAP